MRHSVLEAWLNKQGVKFHYEEKVPLDHIDVDDATKENIRLTVALNEDRVLTYGIELENGAEFPAIVLWPIPKKPGYYVVVNGLHRLEAFRLHIKLRPATDAYVIDSTDLLLLDRLRRTINVIEGEPLNRDQRIEHALHLVERQHSMSDAARLLAIPLKALQVAQAVVKLRPRLEHHGVRMGDLNLSQSAYVYISSIPRDKHAALVATLAKEARMASDDVRLLASEVRAAADDAAAEEVIARWQEKYADTIARAQKGTIRPPGSPIRRLDQYLMRAQRIMEPAQKGIQTLSRRELDDMIPRLRRCIAELTETLNQLLKARRRVA